MADDNDSRNTGSPSTKDQDMMKCMREMLENEPRMKKELKELQEQVNYQKQTISDLEETVRKNNAKIKELGDTNQRLDAEGKQKDAAFNEREGLLIKLSKANLDMRKENLAMQTELDKLEAEKIRDQRVEHDKKTEELNGNSQADITKLKKELTQKKKSIKQLKNQILQIHKDCNLRKKAMEETIKEQERKIAGLEVSYKEKDRQAQKFRKIAEICNGPALSYENLEPVIQNQHYDKLQQAAEEKTQVDDVRTGTNAEHQKMDDQDAIIQKLKNELEEAKKETKVKNEVKDFTYQEIFDGWRKKQDKTIVEYKRMIGETVEEIMSEIEEKNQLKDQEAMMKLLEKNQKITLLATKQKAKYHDVIQTLTTATRLVKEQEDIEMDLQSKMLEFEKEKTAKAVAKESEQAEMEQDQAESKRKGPSTTAMSLRSKKKSKTNDSK